MAETVRSTEAPRTTFAGPPTRRRAAVTALLALALFVAVARVAERHLSVRVDVSEDGLSGWSAATESIVDRLDDLLAIELFFTGEPKHAAAQLHRRRLLDAFDEFEALAGNRVRIVLSDPNASFEDRQRAHRFRIAPLPFEEQSGTTRVQQNVYFGAVLRYRGREEVVPVLSPVTLEYDVASAVHRLVEGERPRIGWYVGDVPVPESEREEGDPARRADTDFVVLRRHLERRFDIADVFGLDSGVRVPAGLDALVLLAPRDLAPRAAFEVEQFVRGGGALVVLADRSRARQEARRLNGYATGLEDLLAAWGAPVAPDLVWDRTSAVAAGTTSAVAGRASIEYPLWIVVRERSAAFEGARFDDSAPVTARLRALLTFWAHPIEPATPPEGVRRRWLTQSSENAWTVPLLGLLELDSASIEATTRQLIAGDDVARRHDLAVALEGVFPPLDAAPVGPPALDPITREPVAGTERARRDEPAASARVAVLGDADWARDGSVATENGLTDSGGQAAVFLENLVDWSVQSDELVALRARVPRDRRLVDFEQRASEAEGVVDAAGIRAATERAERARARARRARLWWTGAALGGSFALVGLIALAAFWRRRRATLVEDAPPPESVVETRSTSGGGR